MDNVNGTWYFHFKRIKMSAAYEGYFQEGEIAALHCRVSGLCIPGTCTGGICRRTSTSARMWN